MEVIKLNIDGMHCSSCEALVKEDLEEIEGIVNVRADNSSGVVSIEYNGKLDMERIKHLVKELGFTVRS